MNLYLWRLRRSVNEAAAGTELIDQEGVLYRRGPKPRMELGYLVTTWATDARNAHQLLGRVLNAFLSTHEIDERFLQGALADVRPLPGLSLSKADDDPPSEFWVALGGRFQPGVELTVTATIDPAVLVDTAPPPTSVETILTDATEPGRSSRRRRVAGRVDGQVASRTVVRTRRGSTVVDATGAFLAATSSPPPATNTRKARERARRRRRGTGTAPARRYLASLPLGGPLRREGGD